MLSMAACCPEGYYALAEQVTQPFGPDVLTLQSNGSPTFDGMISVPGTLAIAEQPPKVRFVQESDEDLYVKKANHIAIRHVSDDRVVAILEILSAGNKHSQHAIEAFLDKVWWALDQGIHLLLVDLFPPTKRDPHGIHGLIWGDTLLPPGDQPLTLAAYQASPSRRAFVEPTAVGQVLIDMPLVLGETFYVPLPLGRDLPGRLARSASAWKRELAPI